MSRKTFFQQVIDAEGNVIGHEPVNLPYLPVDGEGNRIIVLIDGKPIHATIDQSGTIHPSEPITKGKRGAVVYETKFEDTEGN